jgi:magnesium chelatase accessory protein
MLERLHPALDWASLQAQWPHSAHSRFVQAAGLRWHVQVMGQGPALLMLHGTGASTHTWHALAPLLMPHHTLICPDLPGHAFTEQAPGAGMSLPGMAAGVAALVQALGLPLKGLVGHSAGAAVAAQMLLQERLPLTPARPVLVGLNPAWLPLPGWAGVLFSPSAKLMALNPLSGWLMAQQGARAGVLQRLLDSTGSRLGPEAAAHYGVLLRNPRHVRGVLAMMAAWNLDPLARRLHTLPAQVHLHIGMADQTIPPALAEEALQRIPGSTGTQAVGLGHLAHEEGGAEVAQHVLRWLAGAATAAPMAE